MSGEPRIDHGVVENLPDQVVRADRTPSLVIVLDVPVGESLMRSQAVSYSVEADGAVQLVGARRPARPWRPRLVIPLAFAAVQADYWLRVQVEFAVERREAPGQAFRRVVAWAFRLQTNPLATSDTLTLRLPQGSA